MSDLETEVSGPTALFDEQGICRLVVTAGVPPETFPFRARVKDGVRPNDIWFNPETGRVNKVKPAAIAVPATIAVGEEISIPLPADSIATVDGAVQADAISIRSDEAKRIPIEVHGRYRGSFVVEARTYAEERAAAYLPVTEQLDLLYKDPDAWRAHVAEVKASIPKPDPQ